MCRSSGRGCTVTPSAPNNCASMAALTTSGLSPPLLFLRVANLLIFTDSFVMIQSYGFGGENRAWRENRALRETERALGQCSCFLLFERLLVSLLLNKHSLVDGFSRGVFDVQLVFAQLQGLQIIQRDLVHSFFQSGAKHSNDPV